MIEKMLNHINLKIDVVRKKDYPTMAKRIRADEFINGLEWTKNMLVKERNEQRVIS